ncbi:MAG: hypothetical protein ACREK5_12220, partial [Gemmatimonadota bacterium]
MIVAQRVEHGTITQAIVGKRGEGLEPAQEQLEVALTVHPNGGTRTSLRQKEIGSGDPTVTMFYQIL